MTNKCFRLGTVQCTSCQILLTLEWTLDWKVWRLFQSKRQCRRRGATRDWFYVCGRHCDNAGCGTSHFVMRSFAMFDCRCLIFPLLGHLCFCIRVNCICRFNKHIWWLSWSMMNCWHYSAASQYYMVAWSSGRTSVSGQRAFAVLRLTCSWWVTTYVAKPSAIGQPTKPTRPFILFGSINE